MPNPPTQQPVSQAVAGNEYTTSELIEGARNYAASQRGENEFCTGPHMRAYMFEALANRLAALPSSFAAGERVDGGLGAVRDDDAERMAWVFEQAEIWTPSADTTRMNGPAVARFIRALSHAKGVAAPARDEELRASGVQHRGE